MALLLKDLLSSRDGQPRGGFGYDALIGLPGKGLQSLPFALFDF